MSPFFLNLLSVAAPFLLQASIALADDVNSHPEDSKLCARALSPRADPAAAYVKLLTVSAKVKSFSNDKLTEVIETLRAGKFINPLENEGLDSALLPYRTAWTNLEKKMSANSDLQQWTRLSEAVETWAQENQNLVLAKEATLKETQLVFMPYLSRPPVPMTMIKNAMAQNEAFVRLDGRAFSVIRRRVGGVFWTETTTHDSGYQQVTNLLNVQNISNVLTTPDQRQFFAAVDSLGEIFIVDVNTMDAKKFPDVQVEPDAKLYLFNTQFGPQLAASGSKQVSLVALDYPKRVSRRNLENSRGASRPVHFTTASGEDILAVSTPWGIELLSIRVNGLAPIPYPPVAHAFRSGKVRSFSTATLHRARNGQVFLLAYSLLESESFDDGDLYTYGLFVKNVTTDADLAPSQSLAHFRFRTHAILNDPPVIFSHPNGDEWLLPPTAQAHWDQGRAGQLVYGNLTPIFEAELEYARAKKARAATAPPTEKKSFLKRVAGLWNILKEKDTDLRPKILNDPQQLNYSSLTEYSSYSHHFLVTSSGETFSAFTGSGNELIVLNTKSKEVVAKIPMKKWLKETPRSLEVQTPEGQKIHLILAIDSDDNLYVVPTHHRPGSAEVSP